MVAVAFNLNCRAGVVPACPPTGGVRSILGMDFLTLRNASDTLLDAEHRSEWPAAEAVLRQAAVAAYGELVDVIAIGGQDAAARAGMLLGFETMTKKIRDRVLSLRSPDADERRRSVFALGYTGPEPFLPFVRVLTTLLADPDPEVQRETVTVLINLGRDTVPVLQQVRRSPVPERRAALTALAGIGWDTIDPADRRALERLVAHKQASEVPESIEPDGEWYAVRTSDRQTVLDAFDLSDPVPITMRAGAALVRPREHPWRRSWGPHSDHEWCAKVFVSPVLDGWTLVFGTPVAQNELAAHRSGEADKSGDESSAYPHEVWQHRCIELSRRLGSAVYWYVNMTSEDWTAWCLAENGTLVRYYHHSLDEGEVEAGDPLPAETGLRPHTGGGIFDVLDKYAPPDLARDIRATMYSIKDDDAWSERGDEVMVRLAKLGIEVPDLRNATVVARHTSIDLGQLGPATSVAGHGLLALTACGRLNGHSGAFTL